MITLAELMQVLINTEIEKRSDPRVGSFDIDRIALNAVNGHAPDTYYISLYNAGYYRAISDALFQLGINNRERGGE